MQRLLLFSALLLAVAGVQAYGSWDNYKPYNTNVRLTQTNLPIVWIDVDGEMIDTEDRITAKMKIIHNGNGQLNYADTVAHPGQNIDYEGYIALRYRGNSSFSASDKKPYSFRTIDKPLEEDGQKVKVKILGMAKDNNWAILAPFSDKSMMRDMLAFELSRPWMDYTPNGRYCELILDGTYYGVYIITEVVSKGKHRCNLDDPGEEGDELTGGYLVEVDRNDEVTHRSKYHPVNSQGRTLYSRYVYFQYKEPDYEDMTTEQVNYINNQVDAMEDALNSNNFKDPETGYRKYLDPLSFVDYQISQELGHNVDGYRLSAKMFKRRDSQDGHFKMVLWDYNLAYGNADYYNGWYTTGWVWNNNDVLNSSNDAQEVPFWWYKLNQDPYYTNMLHDRWAQCRRANFSNDRIMATIDSIATLLTAQGAESRNSRAWPKWGQYVWPNYYVSQNFEDEISFLKGWINDRLEWMDEQWGFDPNALIRGDINGDGKVDVSDVNILINIMLGKAQANNYPGNPDLNDDGKVDVSDVNAVINIMLGKE